MSDSQHPDELPALTAPLRRSLIDPKQLALLLAIVALVGVLVLAMLSWRGSDRLEATREEMARRLAETEAAQREAQSGAKQGRETLDALQAKISLLETHQAEMQSQQLALETMYQELSRARDDRLIAEVEQEIMLAAQQLQLAGNVPATLIALQAVEARLVKNGQPQFLPLRKLVMRDIERLRALPGADVAGVALKIDVVLEAVPSLPLAFEQRPAKQSGSKDVGQKRKASSESEPVKDMAGYGSMLRDWLVDLWQELRQLVRIERIDRPDPGLLAPNEVFFLRENLRLRLLSARLALLARDGRSFKADLKQATDWLALYFDGQSAAVRETRDTLQSLGRMDVMRDAGDLNETLAALRNLKLARERGAGH